jgi:hypothetical protein
MLDRNMNKPAHNKNKTFFLSHSIDFLWKISRTKEKCLQENKNSIELPIEPVSFDNVTPKLLSNVLLL